MNVLLAHLEQDEVGDYLVPSLLAIPHFYSHKYSILKVLYWLSTAFGTASFFYCDLEFGAIKFAIQSRRKEDLRTMRKLVNQVREVWRLYKEVKEVNRECVKEWQKAAMKSRIYRELGREKEIQTRKARDDLIKLAGLSNRVHQSMYFRKYEKEFKMMDAIVRGARRKAEDEKKDKEVRSQSENAKTEEEFGNGLFGTIKKAWKDAARVSTVGLSGMARISEEAFKEEMIARATKSVAEKGKGMFTKELMEGLLRDGLSKIKLDESKGRAGMLTDLAIGMAKGAGMNKTEVKDFLNQFDTPETAKQDDFLKEEIEKNWSRVEAPSDNASNASLSTESSKKKMEISAS